MRLTGVCFDATGTLIETTENVGEVYHRVAFEFGIDLPAWRLEEAFGRILQQAPARGGTGDSFAARQTNETQWWFARIRETFQATDSTARFEDFQGFAQTLFDDYRSAGAWRLRRGAEPMLRELRRRGYALAIVSNFDYRLPKILEGLEIASLFEAIVIPSSVGQAKPHRALFTAAAQSMRLPKEDLASLAYLGDDSRATLRAIAELGLTVIDANQIKDLAELTNQLPTAATLPPSNTPR
ncbi:MAG: HAD family hydrolase [Myxococcota bacterium]